MRVNPLSLLQVAGFPCVAISGPDDSIRSRTTAVYVNQDTLAAAQQLREQVNDDSYAMEVDIDEGTIIAVREETGGTTTTMRIPLGVTSNLVVPVRIADGSLIDLAITGPGSVRCREAIFAGQSEDGLSRVERRVVDGIRANCMLIAFNPDNNAYSDEMITAAFMVSMVEGYGDIEMSVTPAEFSRKARADTFRAAIGDLDPGHPDGINHSSEFLHVIDDLGIELGENGVGANVRAELADQIDDEMIKRVIASNDRMVREVFGAMTRTPIEDLSVAIITVEDKDAALAQMQSKLMSGAWIDAVRTRVHEITGAGIPNYQASMDIASMNGRDFLFVSDNDTGNEDAGYIYSWPSSHRLPAIEIDGGMVINISAEEVPSEEEVQRLFTVYQALTNPRDTYDLEDLDDDDINPITFERQSGRQNLRPA